MAHTASTARSARARLRRIALLGVGLFMLSGGTTALAGSTITLGEWRTEPGKSLVCGNAQEQLITKIADSANKFYAGGAKADSPEYEVYWSTLQSALKGERCFVTDKMTHQPFLLVYDGPESLAATGKRFKVISTSIKTAESAFPGFTMTTLVVNPVSEKSEPAVKK
ncbi:MAG: hypothetical protein JKY20_08675 [Alphaproteobacteria bacterium]|nr:hypothetical protein [Alphaproteobacteria bacterium]